MPASSSSALTLDPEQPPSPSDTARFLVPGDSIEPAFQAPHPPSIELPVGLPLSHHIFRDPHFDPDQFLLSRRHTSLDDLRAELRTYLASLKAELVGLINEDYEDFIGLGMGLRGTVERTMGKMKAPIEQAKEDVEEARRELQLERADLEGLLAERRKVMDGKKLVRLMLDCGDTVAKIEDMLSIHNPLPEQTPSANSKNTQIVTMHRSGPKHTSRAELSLDLADDPSHMESGTKRIERITNEYNQMLYLVSKGLDLAYVLSLQPRIDQITQALHRELASLLKSTLHTPRSDHRKKECLLECLRAYQTLGAVREAEDVIKKELVLPGMSKLIHRNSLNTGAMSPVLPASPEVARFNADLQSHPSRFPSSFSNPQFTPLALPDDPEHVPLPLLYNKILAFIAREMAVVLEVADRQLAGSKQSSTTPFVPSARDESPSPAAHNAAKPSPNPTYNVLINSVILPTLQLIATTLGNSLFAAGNPATFHRHYSCTMRFLDQLECFCSSPRQVLNLRADREWRGFKNKWQLAVYAQIRTKEIVIRIEEGLNQGTKTSLENHSQSGPTGTGQLKSNPEAGGGYLMKATENLDKVLTRLWDEEVFLVDLTHRFWRLTLMAISRYSTWLDTITAPYSQASGPAGSSTASGGSGNAGSRRGSSEMNRLPVSALLRHPSASRPATPTATANGTTDEGREEDLLRDATLVMADVTRLKGRVLELFDKAIGPRIPRVAVGADSQKPEEIIRGSLEKLVSHVPRLSSQLSTILVRRCSEKLRFIRSVGSSARAAKTMPSEASYFISDILNDLRTYLDRLGCLLPAEIRTKLVSATVDELSARYLAILINVQRSEDSLRKLKKGRQGFSIFNNNPSNNRVHHSGGTGLSNHQHDERNGGGRLKNEVSEDEERVKKQFRLDVEKLEADSIGLGARVEESKAFKELKETVTK